MNNSYDHLIPVLTNGLEYNKLTDEEYVLCNSAYKHYLKINKEVYVLMSIIDGKSDLKKISSKFSDEIGKNITTEFIYILLYEKLIKYGVLKGFDKSVKMYQKPAYLNLSFIIISEQILSKFVKFFYFLFEKKTAFFVSLFSILNVVILFVMYIDLYQSFNLQESLIYFFLIMALSVTFHEIGHATSASFFGANPGGIGGGFYLFTPVYFADVTDIWRLSKKQRIIVNLSGMYFELIFCSILSLVAFFLEQQLLMIISMVVYFHTLFNLNPFLRSDGFWILSDLTNKPNLFFHSTDKVKDLFRILRGKKVKWTKFDYFLLVYGLISLSFVFIFLYYVLFLNSNSIIYFPKNLSEFIGSIFISSSKTSFLKLGELIVPLFFFLLLFNLIKSLFKKVLLLKKNRENQPQVKQEQWF
jgi:putative peptide zinc metalloprotease protein